MNLDILRKYGISEDNSVLVLIEMGALESSKSNNEYELNAKMNRVFNKVEVIESKLNKTIGLLESDTNG
ncbi:hypothetical protein HSZ49_09300 [Staphylococcus saprophyticus]|uniref:hypothetical protein n=1 Tax=Staphylococcus saprophyticus TaxID=29385 RepID=UPI00157CB5CC|nr:hypothetical protein [Staphylococcus saprophyticus]QKQ06012.1 hypothetical protein HSZ49_09300 [Staphylococcus saprophyticus]